MDCNLDFRLGDTVFNVCRIGGNYLEVNCGVMKSWSLGLQVGFILYCLGIATVCYRVQGTSHPTDFRRWRRLAVGRSGLCFPYCFFLSSVSRSELKGGRCEVLAEFSQEHDHNHKIWKRHTVLKKTNWYREGSCGLRAVPGPTDGLPHTRVMAGGCKHY